MTKAPEYMQSQVEIDQALARAFVASDRQIVFLREALDYLPEAVRSDCFNRLLIVSMGDRDGRFLPDSFVENRKIIVIADRLYPRPGESDRRRRRSFIFTVLHEVAHLVRGDDSPALTGMSKSESEDVEFKTDELALRWLNDAIGSKKPEDPLMTRDEIRSSREAGDHLREKETLRS